MPGDDFEFEQPPPRSWPQKWVEPEKADMLRALKKEELAEIRERAQLEISRKMETVAVRAVEKLGQLIDSGKEEIALRAADRVLQHFDDKKPGVIVAVNNQPKFISNLGLPAAPAPGEGVPIQNLTRSVVREPSEPEPVDVSWTAVEPKIPTVP